MSAGCKRLWRKELGKFYTLQRNKKRISKEEAIVSVSILIF